MRFLADDGKVFESADECNAYEADKKLQKEKSDAIRKAKEEKAAKLRQDILKKSKELDDLLDEFQTLTGKKYYYNFTGNEFEFPILLSEFINRMARTR